MIGTIPTETEEEKARVARMQKMSADKIAPSSPSCSAMPRRTSPDRSSRSA
jgi:hypothetical protein